VTELRTRLTPLRRSTAGTPPCALAKPNRRADAGGDAGAPGELAPIFHPCRGGALACCPLTLSEEPKPAPCRRSGRLAFRGAYEKPGLKVREDIRGRGRPRPDSGPERNATSERREPEQ
jgi:hypothetical protein